MVALRGNERRGGGGVAALLRDAVKTSTGFGCTIFRRNVRVATTAVEAGGTGRALGTMANEEITESVYGRGVPFRGVTRTIGKDWVILYVPLRDEAGEIVGMIATYQEHGVWLAGLFRFRAILGITLAALVLLVTMLLRLVRRRGDQLLAQASERARQRERFFATVSHELRSPLVVIMNMASALRATSPDRDVQRTADDVADEARHLLSVIGNILDASKIEAGRMELLLEAVSLQDVLDRALRQARALLEAKRNVGLHEDVPPDLPLVRADAVKLRQVLQNLLSNAAKFTDAGEVRVTARPRDDDMVDIEVSDTGIGMSDEVRERVWEPFVQAEETTSRRFGGTGLGLTIVRGLVEAMGGRVRVRSAVGRGTTFTVSLPRA